MAVIEYRHEPMYQRIQKDLRSKIASGFFEVGDRLPKVEKLCKEHKVSSITIRRAVQNLANEGLVDRVPGAGTFVRSQAKTESPTKSDTISLVFANICDEYPSAIIAGIESIARKAGFKTQIYISDDDYSIERDSIEQIMKEGTGGIIVFGVCHNEANPNCDIFLEVKNKGIPLVLVDTYLPSLDIDHVVCGDFDGSYAITDHFINLDYREIGYVYKPDKVTSIEARFSGFQKAMADNDLLVRSKHIISVEDQAHARDSVAKRYEFICESMKNMKSDLPRAFLCSTDGLALLVGRALFENGVKIPEQIAIGGFGGGSMTRMSLFQIATVLQPQRELGERAAELLLERVARPEDNNGRQHISIPTKLDTGEYCVNQSRDDSTTGLKRMIS